MFKAVLSPRAFRDALRRLVGVLEYLETFFGKLPVEIRCDSSACLGIVAKGFSKALKHIRKLQDVSTKWVKETLDELGILASKVSSEDNGSDCMTKALSVEDTVYHFRFGLNVVNKSVAANEDFLDRFCNGSRCRRFTSEEVPHENCLCNGGRPRNREFHKDFIYPAGVIFSSAPAYSKNMLELARVVNFE